MVSSLINFSARQDNSALQNMDTQPVKAVWFYNTVLRKFDFYWCRVFSDSNEEIAKGNGDERVFEGKTDVVMAGITCPVYVHDHQESQSAEEFMMKYQGWASYRNVGIYNY